jgi:hypothetical protein
MLTVTIASACITFLAIVVTMWRVVPMKLIFGYATYVDVTFTIALLMFMHGTLGGELIATLAGLMLALFLTAGRYVFGYSKVRWIKHVGFTTIDIPSPLKRNVKGKYHAYQGRFHRSA